ncbi:MAG: OadG family protein [Lachnospiraceae bacterium]|nr:OadG family protein [Lachnospiraceae bacterium]
MILPTLGFFTDGTLAGYEVSYGEIPWSEFTMEEVSDMAEKLLGIEVDGYGFYNARSSFITTAESIGNMIKDPSTGRIVTGEISSYFDGDQIIVSVPVECERGSATAEVIFSNDMFLKLESASLTENYTMSQKMGKAGLNTLMGMGTVFIVLILISLLISVFGVIPKIQKNMAAKKEKKELVDNSAIAGIDNAVNQIIANETAGEDDTELVAVIAAAIAAYEGSGSADGYIVRSIRRRR